MGVRVDLYRRYHQRGREGVALAGQALTNDRGEYRAHNLPAGAYFVAANFEGDQTGPQVEDQPRIDGQGREVAAPSYTMTFFPNSEKLSEATPLRIREGDELNGIDIYLRPVQRVNLAGKITDGLTGEVVTAAALTMERLDAGGAGTVPAPSNLTFDRDQRFHLKNVAPGTYQLWVEAASENQRLVGRAELHVTNSDIENLEIAALPLRVWKGEMITATGSLPLPRGFTPQVTLEARSERGNVIVPQVSAKGEFDVAMLPGETYDVFVNNLPDNFYLSEIRVGGSDVRALGLSTSMAANLPFQIVADSRGARVSGGVIGEGATEVPWSGATVALIPDPSKNRLQWFRQGFADEDGAFSLAGVAPGRYILTAWFDEPPCDLYDTDQSPACRAAGMEVDVVNGARDGLLLRMKNAR
ncbi:MAG: carboxypeptidase regulatory-like domain-containing protein [Acidobacteriota bacterium]